MRLIKKQKASAGLIDFTANLSVTGIFQIVEDAVTEHMGELNIDGITVKRLYNAVWVFTKNRLKLIKDIGWGEEFTAEAFVSSVTKATIIIDVAVKNSAGEICAYSRVEMCPLDIETGRIKRVETVGCENLPCENSDMELMFDKFATAELPEIESVKVRNTNIDFARHTNNKEYVRFILNTFSVKELEISPVKELEVVYAGQTFEGDIISVCGNGGLYELKKDGKCVVKCKIVR